MSDKNKEAADVDEASKAEEKNTEKNAKAEEAEKVMEEILEELEAEAAKSNEGDAPGDASDLENEDPQEETEESDNSDEDGEDVAEAKEGQTGKAKGKGFFKKKTDKKEEAYKERIAALEDQVKRQMAEFDNFRKRTEKEKSQMFETGAISVIEKILPVIDNFERGLAVLTEEEKTSSFAEGMSMIYKQLNTELEKIGVKPIEAQGQPFNPDYHNAVMQDPDGEGESGTVTKELQKGYMFRDSVVRHSMVAVKN